MANLGQGAIGAGVGFATGGPVGGILGGIQGLFGGGHPQEDPIAKQQRLFQQNIANQFMQQANQVPGSDPYSMASLAQDRGQLGANQRTAQSNLFSQWNPQMTTSLSDMANNLASRFTGQQMALSESHMLNALSQRQQALLNAASVAPRGGAQYQPQSNLPQLLGQLAQMHAYQQGRNKSGGSTATNYNAAGDVPMAGPYGPGTMAGPAPPAPIPWAGVMGAAGFSPQGQPGADAAGTDALLGGLPPPQYLQGDQAPANMQAANAVTGAMMQPGNEPGGQNSMANQSRQPLQLNWPPAGLGLRFPVR